MVWESITPAGVVVVLLGVVWKFMNTRIDDKASVGNLNAHIEAWERAQEKTDEDIREIRARHDRELTEINKRHDNNLRELRQEINGMSDRLDKRFDQIISMLSASWGGK